MKHPVCLAIMMTILCAAMAPAGARPFDASHPAIALPFTATLSNTTPLVFGMDAADAARALQSPLTYVSGRPGDEIFLSFRSHGGGGLFPRRDRLYMQFRKGRLTGWKGDWGRNWMWQ